MKKKLKFIIPIVFLIVVLFFTIFLSFYKDSDNITLDDVKLNRVDKKGFAIMVKEDSEYTTYEGSSWPEDYNFNKADCYDNTGNLASDVEVTYEDGKITVNTTKTVYCTLYFDKIVIPTVDELIDTNSKGQIQSAPVEGDTLRRFQGTNETVLNNYICFGTNDEDTCTSIDGQSKYMYRIMGIDVNTNELKIIKKEALDTAYKWHSTFGDNSYTWNNVMLFKQLNGIDTGSGSYPSNIFLSDTTYVPNTNIINSGPTWTDAIETHTWSYGDITTYDDTAIDVLKAEQTAWESGSNHGTVDEKIGLMYLSDYYLAKGNDAKCASSSDGCNTNNWLFIGLNDTDSPGGNYEWTMSRYDSKTAWNVYYNGYVSISTLGNELAVRPVFYLRSQISLEGDGSIGNPYRITGVAPTIDKVEVTSDTGSSFTVEVTASENATKYCYKLDIEQEYKCTKSNTNEFTNVNANTNYTISAYVENKNGLRSDIRNVARIPIGNKVVEYSNHGDGGYGPSDVTKVTDPIVNRFYGTNPNNYICFGSLSCSNNDDNMYRIIGATSDGKLKIIKQTQLSIIEWWHTTTSATWENAYLRSELNNNLFYNKENLVPLNWKQYIYQTPSWCIGDVVNSTNGSDVLTQEIVMCKAIANSPIGLINLSDYYFAYDGNGNTNCYNVECRSWMTLGSTEWTMSRYSSSAAWLVYSGGNASYYAMTGYNYAVRPTFYLKSTVKLSGTGKVDDPFIITGLAS